MSGERPRWVAFALAGSVLVNLFLAGLIVGALTVPAFLRNAPAHTGLVPREEIRQLPVAERAAFVAAIRRHSAEMRRLHERVRAAKEEAAAAIGKPHFDSAEVAARLAAMRQAQLEQGAELHATIVEGLTGLSAKSRAEIAAHAEANAEAAP